MKLALPIIAVVTAGAVSSIIDASARWRRGSTDAAEALMSRAPRIAVTEDDFRGVPPVIDRYLRRALPIGTVPSSIQIRHEGTFLLNGTWRTFRSTERFSVEPRGFLWEARIRVAPGVDVFVRDSSIGGIGSTQAAVGGIYSVMNQRGGDLLAAGALQRYLAEASWLPAALLPRYGVAWEGIDETRARGTLVEGGTSVSLEFRFDADGDVTYVYSPSRPREFKGGYAPTPWGGRSWNYQDRCGMRIPLESEVEWIVDGARQPYFRGRIVNVACDAM